MIQIKSITIDKKFVKAPVHIKCVIENGETRMVRFTSVGFVSKDRIRFEREPFAGTATMSEQKQ